MYKTGIARVWKSLLEAWSNDGFARHIILLDRDRTAPKISGIAYLDIPRHDYNHIDVDREMLQQICDREGADLFISSYYTTPISTPSVLMIHDMIPEVFNWNLEHPMWQEKHHAIHQASAYIAVSENSAQDLVKFFPQISWSSVTVAHNGIDHQIFSPAAQEKIDHFRIKYGIYQPYFLLVGAGDGYKNSILFFRAFAELPSHYGFDIVIISNGASALAPEFRTYTSGSTVHMLQLSDEELAVAYSGAVTHVYLSQYESFGIPIVEAMACGCPVITCHNAPIPEVAGDAVIYVNDQDVKDMANSLCDVQKPNFRGSLITSGLSQAEKFSWRKMAEIVSEVLVNATLLSLNLRKINLMVFPDWRQPEEIVSLELEQVMKAVLTCSGSKDITLLINTDRSFADAELLISSIGIYIIMQEKIDNTKTAEISLVRDLVLIQWRNLLPKLYARVVLPHEAFPSLIQLCLDKIPSRQLDELTHEIN
jgi:glycosyltransferase involved in cell wall biosynthesis